jgi:hypothetical protein
MLHGQMRAYEFPLSATRQDVWGAGHGISVSMKLRVWVRLLPASDNPWSIKMNEQNCFPNHEEPEQSVSSFNALQKFARNLPVRIGV